MNIEQETCLFCGKAVHGSGQLIKPPASNVFICYPCALSLFSLDDDSIGLSGGSLAVEGTVKDILETASAGASASVENEHWMNGDDNFRKEDV